MQRPTLYFPRTSLVKPYLEKTHKIIKLHYKQISEKPLMSIMWPNLQNKNRQNKALSTKKEMCRLWAKSNLPQVYYVVLVVPSVEMDIIGIDQKEPKQDEQYL